MSLEPIILEFDDKLSKNESFIGIQSIFIPTGPGKGKVGYVATIKNYKSGNLHYGNLKATKHTEGDINNQVF